MFGQTHLHQEARSRLTSGGAGTAAGDQPVKVEPVGLCDDYEYLSYDRAGVVSAHYGLGDEASGSASETQAEELGQSVEDHVEVVHFMDNCKDSSWGSVNNFCQDGGNMPYDISNIIMVSMDTDNHAVEGEGRNGVTSAADTAHLTMNEENDGDGSSKTAKESSTSENVRSDKGYYCSKCKTSLPTKRHFLNHLRLHFKSKEFECTECGESFYQRHCLELHRVTHLGVQKDKPVVSKQLLFECKLCRMRFSSIGHLKTHIDSMHRVMNKNGLAHQSSTSLQKTVKPDIGHHICYHCQNTFKDRRTFSKHIKIHSMNFECIACPKSFNSKEELKTHNWTHFSFYSCSVCDSVFKSTKELARHETVCLSHLLSNKDLVNVTQSDKLLVCDVCGDVFVRRQDFKRHLQGHVKQFRCKHCGSGYHSQAALDEHEKFHEFNSHAYKCSDCPKSFYSLPLLQSHQAKHVAAASQCSICKEVFASEEERHKHKHLFLGNMKCDLCSIQCSGSHGLNMHKRLAHPDIPDTLCFSTPKKNGERVVVCVGDGAGQRV